GGEEERLVAAVVQLAEKGRPAGRESVALVAGVVLRTAGALGGEVVRGRDLIAVVIVGVTLDLVGAALERHVRRRAGRVALLRVERRGLHLELLDGIGRRHEGDAPAGRQGRRARGG